MAQAWRKAWQKHLAAYRKSTPFAKMQSIKINIAIMKSLK